MVLLPRYQTLTVATVQVNVGKQWQRVRTDYKLVWLADQFSDIVQTPYLT